ncbi:tetratricopeptide repeat protein [Candidatus Bipolaricaulota bacterium]
MVNASTVSKPDPIADLSSDLARLAHELVNSIVEMSRIHMHSAQYAEALALVDSDLIQFVGTHVSAADIARIRIAKAAVLHLRSRDSGEGRADVMRYIETTEAAVLGSEDKEVLAEYLQVRASAVMEQELMAGRSYDAALDPLTRALALFEETGNQNGIAESLFGIGLVHEFRREDIDSSKAKAFDLYQRARSIAREVGDLRVQSDAARHLGGIEQDRGNLDAALAMFEESLALRQKLGYRGTLPGAYDAVAAIHLEKGNLDEALKYIAQTQRWAEETGFQRYVLLAKLRAGDVFKARGERQEAEDKYREALAVAEASSFQPGIDWASELIEKLDHGRVEEGMES